MDDYVHVFIDFHVAGEFDEVMCCVGDRGDGVGRIGIMDIDGISGADSVDGVGGTDFVDGTGDTGIVD